MENKDFNIIISPAKKMNICDDDMLCKSSPKLISRTDTLYNYLKSLSFDELRKLLDCNNQIAETNYSRYKNLNLLSCYTPAILSYDGIQYKYMSPNTFSDVEFHYIQNHLKILSGFYGVLKPLDNVTPYRLEMQAKVSIDSHKNLYSFWGDSIYKEITKNSNFILNLASKEYSKVVEKYLSKDDIFITCTFGSLQNSKIKVKATEAKMARGAMVRFLASNNINNIQEIKNFSELSFTFSHEYSTPNNFVFLK